MGLERLKALFCRRGSGDPLAFSKSEVFDRDNIPAERLQVISAIQPRSSASLLQQDC